MNDYELNRRELTGDAALRFAREAGMLRMVGSPDFTAGVGDLIRFARLVRAGWTPPAQAGEATADQLIELAGALEQRRGLAIVEVVTALSGGYHDGAFRAGFETACEEITLRLRTEVWENCLPPVDAPKPSIPHGPARTP